MTHDGSTQEWIRQRLVAELDSRVSQLALDAHNAVMQGQVGSWDPHEAAASVRELHRLKAWAQRELRELGSRG